MRVRMAGWVSAPSEWVAGGAIDFTDLTRR